MGNWLGIYIIIFVCVLGLLRNFNKYKDITKKNEFTTQFLSAYREFCSDLAKNCVQIDKYEWLKINSVKIQKMMGKYGIADTYQPAGVTYLLRDYAIILNGISEVYELSRRMYQGIGSPLDFEISMFQESARMIDDSLLMYYGVLKNDSEDKLKELINPFIWLRDGVRGIVTFPIYLLYWSGLMQYATYNKVNNNFVVKFISLIFSVLGVVSSVVTVVTGYTPFITILNGFIK
ncbi:hypothetical protein PP175_29570 (plasmid) [Aneurinibacillus sp. Ricciae_BoGa-3]|uniref:hypothetical protein n=1 Tax=Aneurinibacillus sp. Ricciae_BoGa-3 TaxID=3022697 RepID=UPI002341E05C|nr:hypothetical protein [Aneurinibacillus sp. Ricciae_BoGa-3]WCK57342.1 hypothetical protein PP175_29570 [Aneurinibacillus sp. Ricciae_BoGa-3]